MKTFSPINKVYNIVIYAHIALNCIDQLLKDIDYNGNIDDVFNKSKNILPDHTITYLNEKADKYLGISYDMIDHTKLFDVIHGTIIVNDLSELVDSFSEVWGYMHDGIYLIIEDDILFSGYSEKKYTVRGGDYKVTAEIKDYLNLYDKKGEVDALVRDMQLKTILK